MTIEADLIDYLKGYSALTALVSSRIYPMQRPQAQSLPSITVTRISGNPVYSDEGEAGIEQVRVQIDVWGSTYGQAKAAAGAVRDRLSGTRDVTQGSTTFVLIDLEDERERQEGGSNVSEYLFSVSLDWLIWV